MAFWRTYYHLVWATKYRQDILKPGIEERVHGYIVQRAADLGVYVYAIDGWFDHVHLVVAVPPRLAVAHVVRHLKGASAHFATHHLDPAFAWQQGYGVLTVGERQRPIVEKYVRLQKQHHRAQTINTWLEMASDDEDGSG
jgi:REP element-mobilizing transposase RayT